MSTSNFKPARPVQLTQRQLHLLERLREHDQALGSLYRASVTMVRDRSFPARARLIAHAVREIRNRLPDAVAGPRSGGRLDYKNKMDGLARAWDRAGVVTSPLVKRDEENRAAVDRKVALPVRLVRKIEKLISEHKNVRERKKEKAWRLIQVAAPETAGARQHLEACAYHWYQVTEWFVGIAKGGTTDEATLESNFEHFEALLTSVLGHFFEAVDGLDEILEDANA
jgi:hypothetical protein